MRLTPAQVTLLREAEHQFLGNVASRGVNYHIAMEEFVEEVLKIVLPPPDLTGISVDGDVPPSNTSTVRGINRDTAGQQGR